ncbi:hypothetical protein DMC47_40460 [Nostoc sp. 3335mG]|nr:hypothetical protein DMC47_40460 [Nostoc sp. 3335mG]
MINALEARRQVRLHSPAWADEAIETYGDGAAAFLRSVEGGFTRAERYAFRQVRKAIVRKQRGIQAKPSLLAVMVEALYKGPTIGADIAGD